MHIKIRNLRKRVERRWAWPEVCDVKILIAIIWIFCIGNVQIQNTREREYREGGGGLGFVLKKFQ